MAGELKWNGALFRACTIRQVEAGLRAMGAETAAIAGIMASKPYPPASVPGESPHVRTGFGGDQIAHVFAQARRTAQVGYRQGATYMIFHELGIRYPTRGPAKGSGRLQQRPSVVPAFKGNVRRIVQIGQIAAKSAAKGGK